MSPHRAGLISSGSGDLGSPGAAPGESRVRSRSAGAAPAAVNCFPVFPGKIWACGRRCSPVGEGPSARKKTPNEPKARKEPGGEDGGSRRG